MKWSENNKPFEQPPAGTHVARCIKLIDIGTQKEELMGKIKFLRKVVISWELPNTLMSDGEYEGKPFVTSKFYTQGIGEKYNLRKDLINWRGRDFTEDELQSFEAKNILGKPCMLSITLDDKKKAKITGVMALPTGMECPAQVNPSVFFSLDDFNQEVFDNISKGIKAKIESSPEYKSLSNPIIKDDFQDAVDQTFTNYPEDAPF